MPLPMIRTGLSFISEQIRLPADLQAAEAPEGSLCSNWPKVFITKLVGLSALTLSSSMTGCYFLIKSE